jgi:hypothetical protein
MSSPLIWSGNDAKLLKKNLDFSDVKIITGTFTAANNQAAATNVTGLVFANATYRATTINVSVYIDATTDLHANYTLQCIQKSSSWEMSQEYTGDATGIIFSITSAGQVQYSSTNVSGYSSSVFKYSATATDI